VLTIALSFVGGALTILSPCILPVVPFVFARSDLPFFKSVFPVLLGMSLSFAALAALSATGGHWVVEANQVGRSVALVVFAILGVSLLSSRFAELLSRPFVALGGLLQRKADAAGGALASLLIGASLGFVWAPCAGPILGLVLAGASLGKSVPQTVVLLLAFALGAATSLGVVAFAGGRLLSGLKKSLGVEQWLRRGLGVMVLSAVFAITFHLDARALAALPSFDASPIEEHLVRSASGNSQQAANVSTLADEGAAPSFDGVTTWLNSAPLTTQGLRGKVLLVDFWTYSCINCLRTLPHVKAWDEKYRSSGLVVVGVHTPEFAFERDVANVKAAVAELGIRYPVAVDSSEAVW
jgi:cytochrome c biogenesis protein CcdA/thiol-disulfide isomerase/thioredoxin